MRSLKKIICPIDFSPTSYEALKGAEQLALLVNAELILMHVIAFPAPNDQGFKSEQEASDFARKTAEDKLHQIIATQLGHLKGTRIVILNGSPAGQLIVDAARGEDADLIVMGTHGWTGWRHLVLGSVTEEVMHFADCPVLTVHSAVNNLDPQNSQPKILCPIDFSEPSIEALKIAGAMAGALNAQVNLLHVLEPISVAFGELSAEQFKRLRDGAAARAMAPLIQKYFPQELQASALSNRLLRKGRPSTEIVSAAQEGGFDLIVMATQGESGWRRLFVGSVATEIVRNAPCPVLTVGHGVSKKSNVPIGITSAIGDKEQEETTMTQSEPEKQLTTPPRNSREEAGFPLAGSSEEKFRFLLRYAVLAPSNRNSQPWLWRLSGNTAELYADRTRALPHLDPDDRELIISCGAALLHLRIAMRHFGFTDKVTLLPDRKNRDLLAIVELGENYTASPEEERLFEAIPLRHTNRHPFLDRELPTAMKTDLQIQAKSEGLNLFLIEGNDTRLALIRLIARSSRAQGHDPLFVEETLGWIRPSHKRTPSADGIPQSATGGGGLLSHYATDVGAAKSEKDELLAWSAPLLVALQTDDDRPNDWLAAGQALAKVLLRSAADGVQASFFNGPVEIVTMWPQLHDILKHAGLPQMILRLGYPSQEADPTPRRQVDEVIKAA